MAMLSPSYSGTYFVQDQQMEEELIRLTEQDRLVTASMGGVLAEQANPGEFRRVLDVACGTGSWAIDMARTYPELSLVGIDIHPGIIAYAREQAVIYDVQDRVEFQVMDALRVLDFPDRSFDLLNLRFALGFVRTWEWTRLLADMLRVIRPGGIIRLTDEDIMHQSTSPASMQFCAMLLCALFRSGHLFTQDSTGLIDHLAPLLCQQGFQQVQTQVYALQYRAKTPEGLKYAQDGVRIVRTLRPFIQKWGCASADYDTIQQRVSEEVYQPNFSATWQLLTVWGTRAV